MNKKRYFLMTEKRSRISLILETLLRKNLLPKERLRSHQLHSLKLIMISSMYSLTNLLISLLKFRVILSLTLTNLSYHPNLLNRIITITRMICSKISIQMFKVSQSNPFHKLNLPKIKLKDIIPSRAKCLMVMVICLYQVNNKWVDFLKTNK